MSSIEILGQRFDLDEPALLQAPDEYVKIQLGKIVLALKFDTIYDSLTGYDVGTLNAREMREMLDQIWHGELKDSTLAAISHTLTPTAADFLPTIESGVDQLRIRMLATMRPTPALSYQRDMGAMERIRRHDPNRILSYLLIAFCFDLPRHVRQDFTLESMLARHEKAIRLGQWIRDGKAYWGSLEPINKALIELDARFGILKCARLVAKDIERIEQFAEEITRITTQGELFFPAFAEYVNRLIAMCENRLQEEGDRRLHAAHVELTREQVVANIVNRADAMRWQESMEAASREKRKAGKAKQESKAKKAAAYNIDFSALDIAAFLAPTGGES